MAILDVAIVLGLFLVSSYYQLKPRYWISIIGLTLLAESIFGHLGILAVFFWGIYLLAVLFTCFPHLRQRYFTNKIMQVLQHRMPSISQTEREAIEAGNTWWEKDLLSGKPDWNKLLSYTKPELKPQEQGFLDNQVETLCAMLNDWELVHHDHDMSQKIWHYLQKEKFFGLIIPQEYGGLGFSALGHSSIVAKIATRSVSAAVNMMVPNSLGPAELLLHYGTAEQKAHYLPRLANGEEIPCFALTGTDAGSDASSIPDRGIVCQEWFQGRKTLGIRLNWDKRYITLAPIATVLGLAFHLYDPEHLLGEKEDVGITLALIPTSHPGVEIGRRHLPLYLAFMNGPTKGKDVFIPLDWIIGGPEMAGRGWRMLMECLSVGRAISLPALSTACGQLVYRITGAYSRIRKQFNMPIGYFEGIEELLSTIAGNTYFLEATRLMTAGAVDQGIRPTIASAIAKYHMTEMARDIINKAMDIHGGHAIQTGPHNLLANVYMAMPMSITVEGANALTRNLIIFGQGLTVCHPYLLQELNLLTGKQDDSSIKKFDQLLLGHICFVLRNFSQLIWQTLTGGKFIPLALKVTPKKKIINYYQQMTRVSTLLAFFTDIIVLLLGGNLKKRERISARLGDILSQLYLASATLKYYFDQNQPEEDEPYLQWCIQTCLYRSQIALKELTNNFPLKWLGKLLKIFIPRGRMYSRPNDYLCHQVVMPMLSPNSLRDRLTQNCYQTKNPHEWLTLLEATLMQAGIIDPIAKKFQNLVRQGKVPAWVAVKDQVHAAVKAELLTKEEAEALLDYEKRRQEVIKVSEFTFDLNKVIA
jgi:acyl-CoA dehydrogenase